MFDVELVEISGDCAELIIGQKEGSLAARSYDLEIVSILMHICRIDRLVLKNIYHTNIGLWRVKIMQNFMKTRTKEP